MQNPSSALQTNWYGGMTGSLFHMRWWAVVTNSE
uniref:Uncharacterized protein n=1 Tax=Anguilla anguilla TaxID=7936 RepID=A0A0E9UUT8_ANGAN